jgi:hypothetical protein
VADRRLYLATHAGQTWRRETKTPYTRLILKRPATFVDGWQAHAWVEEPAKAEQMAARLRKHAWVVEVVDVTGSWRVV